MIDDILTNLKNLGQNQNVDPAFKDAVALSEYYIKIQDDLLKLSDEKQKNTLKLQSLKSGEASEAMNLNKEELQKKVLDLYMKKDEKEKNVKEITKEVEQKRNEKESLELELKTLTEKKNALAMSVESLEKEINSLNKYTQTRKQEITDVENQMKDAIKNIEVTETEIRNIKSKTQRVELFIKEAEKNTIHRPLTHFHTKFSGHSDATVFMKFSQSYDTLYTIGKDKKFAQWDLRSLTEKRSVMVPGIPNSFRINDEMRLAAISCDKSIQLIDIDTGRNQGQLTSHNDICTDNFWISRNQIISSSKDRTVKIFDINSKRCIFTISTATAVYSICQTVDPVVFAAAGFDGKIRLIDIRERKIAQKIDKIHDRLITCILPSSSRDRFYTLSLDNTICEISAKTNTVIRKLAVPSSDETSSAPDPNSNGQAKIYIKDQFTKMSIDPTGGYLCVGTNCGTVLLFDLLQDGVVYELKEHKEPVTCTAIAANLLVTADTSNTIAFWT